MGQAGVRAEGLSFKSLHLAQGVEIVDGSLTMTNCMSTASVDYHSSVRVLDDTSLVMEDCLIFGSRYGSGTDCRGNIKATRCTFEDNALDLGSGDRAGTADLVNCTIKSNGEDGIYIHGRPSIPLTGCTVSDNGEQGVCAVGGAKVIVKDSISKGLGDAR